MTEEHESRGMCAMRASTGHRVESRGYYEYFHMLV